MATPGIGDPYWFEWYVGLKNIINMLNPDNGIEYVIMEEVPVSAYPKEFSQSWVNGELTGEQMKTTLLAFHKR